MPGFPVPCGNGKEAVEIIKNSNEFEIDAVLMDIIMPEMDGYTAAKEIRKLEAEVKTPGITIVPIKMFINERGLCKVEIALCKGKKEFDKRESIKERDTKRELDAAMKNYR